MLSLPNRTWKGEHDNEPSGCSTTTTSTAPLRVAGLISEYNLETVEKKLPTDCIYNVATRKKGLVGDKSCVGEKSEG